MYEWNNMQYAIIYICFSLRKYTSFSYIYLPIIPMYLRKNIYIYFKHTLIVYVFWNLNISGPANLSRKLNIPTTVGQYNGKSFSLCVSA